MIEYTQMQLLEGNFWNKFTTNPLSRGVKTIAKTGAKIVDTVLPELTAPIKQARGAGAAIGTTAINAWRSPKTKITKAMENQGIVVKDIKPTGKNYLMTGYEMDYYDSGKKVGTLKDEKDSKPIRRVVDENGDNIKSLKQTPPPTSSKTKPPSTTTASTKALVRDSP